MVAVYGRDRILFHFQCMDLSRGRTGTTSLIFDIAKRCEGRSLNGTLNGRNGRRERKSSKFNASISTTTGPLLSVQLSIIIFFPDAFSAWLGSDTRTSWGGFQFHTQCLHYCLKIHGHCSIFWQRHESTDGPLVLIILKKIAKEWSHLQLSARKSSLTPVWSLNCWLLLDPADAKSRPLDVGNMRGWAAGLYTMNLSSTINQRR